MSEERLYKALGKNIKNLRENHNLTQEQLAEISGLSLDYIGKIEVCINKPGLRSLIKISKALNIHLKEIFDFDY